MRDQPTAPNQRSFTLNSPEAYEALCPRDDQPWIPNGALPRQPRVWDKPALVERDLPVIPDFIRDPPSSGRRARG